MRDSSGAGVAATRSNNIANRRWDESGGETFVAMMKAGDLRHGDDSPDPGWHDRTRIRAILIERKMSAGSVVVVDIC